MPNALTHSLKLVCSGNFGTPIYLAPELFENEKYDPSVDVYSFSIIAFEIIAKCEAYSHMESKGPFDFMKKVSNGERPQMSDELFTKKMQNLLNSCWSKTPNQRPTFEAIFHELSTNFSYLKEEVDTNAIKNYLSKVTKVSNTPKQVIMGDIKVNVNEVDDMFFNLNDYKITKKELGSGAFSKVFIAERKKDKQKFSARVIHADMFKEHEQMILLRESFLLHKFNHPFITKFYGLNLQSPKDSNEIKPTIITEYLEKGSLSNISGLNKPQKAVILLGVAHAMKFVHKVGVTLGFLCPDNILIDDEFFPRIRFPHSFSSDNQKDLIIQLGNDRYLAPELLAFNEEYGKEVDIFAFGVLILDVITDNCSCDQMNQSFFYRSQIANGITDNCLKFPTDFPEDIKKLVKDCCDFNVSQRPSFDEIYDILYDIFKSDCENIGQIRKMEEKIEDFD